MKKTLTALLAAILHCAASASEADAAHARLTDSQVLLTDANPTKATFADCQPLKGEVVAILETRSNVDGMKGVTAARVRVLGGQCRGAQGWVGLLRLEKLTGPARQ